MAHISPGSQTVLSVGLSTADGRKEAGPGKPRNNYGTESSTLIFALSLQPKLTLLNIGCYAAVEKNKKISKRREQQKANC